MDGSLANCLAQTKLPDGSSFSMNELALPLTLVRVNVPGPGSMSADPLLRTPELYTFPAVSSVIASPLVDASVPPSFFAHTSPPAGAYLATKAEPNGAAVRLVTPGPKSKSVVPVKVPVANTDPSPATASLLTAPSTSCPAQAR